MDVKRGLAAVTVLCLLEACHSPGLEPTLAAFVEPSPDPASEIAAIVEPVVMPIEPPEPVPPALPVDLWQTLRDGFAIAESAPETEPRMQAAMRWITAGGGLVSAMGPRARSYLPYVVQEVQARGLPLELALLPIIESTLDPYAASTQGAAGMWQLIPATARHYGVHIDWWYDGRRDVVDSTEAALSYLTNLHGKFDDWLLALAAYNCGETRIRRTLARNPRATFWTMPLPTETARYVPRILALARVIRTPEAYGVVLPDLAHETQFSVNEFEDQVDLEKLAALAAIPLDDIFRLNAGLNHTATPPQGPHRLLVPDLYLEQFESALTEYSPGPRQWAQHQVRRGETLGSIARRHDISIQAVRDANSIRGDLIRPGDVLLVPPSAMAAHALKENPLVRATRYSARHKVKRGESLWTISRRTGTSVGALVRANAIDPKATLRIGQVLRIPRARPSQSASSYEVKRGDSLSRIAQRFKVSVGDLVRWNSLDPSRYLRPGQRLRIPSA